VAASSPGDRFAPDFAEGMADDDHAGPANQLVRDPRASGIDLTDESAVQRWVPERNQGLLDPRTRLTWRQDGAILAP
jgi:hypothetical protein